MFSPYYAMARRRTPGGLADPTNHCAMNVALYGPRRGRWSMTERGRAALAASHDTLTIGPSDMRWDGQSLHVSFDEITTPAPRRLRGTVRVSPAALTTEPFVLNPAGGHVWHPIAPRARVEVACSHPDLAWNGEGYFDHNRGEGPLETGFRTWNWSRAPQRQGAVVFYGGTRYDLTPFELALRFGAAGEVEPIAAPPAHALPRTAWRMARDVRSDAPPRIIRTLEDAPFYARSAVRTRLFGDECEGVHESLSLDRFRSPVVQAMLPFRMPRRTW